MIDPKHEPDFRKFSPMPASNTSGNRIINPFCTSSSTKISRTDLKQNIPGKFELKAPITIKKDTSRFSKYAIKYLDYSKISDKEALRKLKKPMKNDLFPTRLHKIVESSEQEGLSSIVSWCQHGRAFKIYNKKLFLEKIIFHSFYMRTMRSFVRQLSSYG